MAKAAKSTTINPYGFQEDEGRDPRDERVLPRAFGSGKVSGDPRNLRRPSPVADGIVWGSIYWCYGEPPRELRLAHGVVDPPCSGWSTAFMLEASPEAKTVTLFHPGTMRSWSVPRDCYEMRSFQGRFEGFPLDRFKDNLPRLYAEYRRRGDASAAFEVCARVIEAIGAKVPTEAEMGDLKPLERGPVAVSHAPVAPKAEKVDKPFKPVKKDGRRGEVLQFFLDRKMHGSIDEAMKQFKITRSNLLSQLFLLRKEHGIGYAVSGDQASIQLPVGVSDPFAG